METNPDKKAYEVSIRVLGNEVFALALSSSSDSNRLYAIGLLTVIILLTILGAFGTNLINLYRMLVG